MSRSRKGGKSPGAEYWKSRLHKHGEAPGPFTKRLTHRKERREGAVVVEKSKEGND